MRLIETRKMQEAIIRDFAKNKGLIIANYDCGNFAGKGFLIANNNGEVIVSLSKAVKNEEMKTEILFHIWDFDSNEFQKQFQKITEKVNKYKQGGQND